MEKEILEFASGVEGGWQCGCPDKVLSDPIMTVQEKREVLASWASDARAVKNHPALRCLDDGVLLSIDDILNALKALDRATPSGPDDDDNDDPPTAPALAMPRPRPWNGGAMLAAAA